MGRRAWRDRLGGFARFGPPASHCYGDDGSLGHGVSSFMRTREAISGWERRRAMAMETWSSEALSGCGSGPKSGGSDRRRQWRPLDQQPRRGSENRREEN